MTRRASTDTSVVGKKTEPLRIADPEVWALSEGEAAAIRRDVARGFARFAAKYGWDKQPHGGFNPTIYPK